MFRIIFFVLLRLCPWIAALYIDPVEILLGAIEDWLCLVGRLHVNTKVIIILILSLILFLGKVGLCWGNFFPELWFHIRFLSGTFVSFHEVDTNNVFSFENSLREDIFMRFYVKRLCCMNNFTNSQDLGINVVVKTNVDAWFYPFPPWCCSNSIETEWILSHVFNWSRSLIAKSIHWCDL